MGCLDDWLQDWQPSADQPSFDRDDHPRFVILGSIAEFEHALMSERTMDGLAAARPRGRTGGQKPKLGERQARLAREMYEAGELTVAQIAAEFGVTRPTIYRHLDRFDEIDAQRQASHQQ